MKSDAGQPMQSGKTSTRLPLPDPYPEYLICPHCGELEVEVWCYQLKVPCHRCGHWIEHTPAPCRGTTAICRVAIEFEQRALEAKPP